MIPGDDKPHAWRQTIHSPAVRTFTLSAMVKGEDAHFGREGYAMLYGHIIYKDRPYEDATHFYAKLPPGTFDWKKISVVGAANKDYPIECVYITVTGRLSAGQMMVDQVELTEDRSATPEALLAGKIDDLMKQLDRVGAVDATVDVAREHLSIAKQKLAAADQPAATAGMDRGGRCAEPQCLGGDVPGCDERQAGRSAHDLSRRRQQQSRLRPISGDA